MSPHCAPEPAYLKLTAAELSDRARRAREIMRSCTLCPRKCRVDRLAGELGACGIGGDAIISSHGAHFGEEPVLVGRHGSGTIFLTGCNLACAFCQNYDISHLRRGSQVSTAHLSDVMIELQSSGCHNINFVTPTHQVPQILEALKLAIENGLKAPLVYNCGGYEPVDVLKILDGIVDIYMPDIKYGDNQPGETYSGVPDYWDRSREAIIEMHRQIGDLDVRNVTDSRGAEATIAVRGLLVRHLVLPNGLAFTPNVVRFLADKISTDTYINVMAQYRPQHDASQFPEIARPITVEEFREALTQAREAGLHRFAD